MPDMQHVCRALSILGVASLFFASVAHGYTCDVDDLDAVRFQLEPADKTAAPRNSRIRLFWNQQGDFEFVRLQVHKTGGPEISGTSKRLAKEGEPGLEFVPTQLLAADTQYDVSILVKSSDGDGPNSSQTRKIGNFRTNQSLDEEPPHGRAVVDGALVLIDLRTDANNEHYPSLQLTVGDVADETTSMAKLLFAVWSSDAKNPTAAIDYTRPPHAYFHSVADDYGGHQVLMFHSHHVCTDTDFSNPSTAPTWKSQTNSWRLPKSTSALSNWRIGVRAVDQAGNQGPKAELTIDLSKPVYAARAEDLRDVCENAKPKDALQILPRDGATAPLNTHIWIWEGKRHQGVFGRADGPSFKNRFRLLDAKKVTIATTSRSFLAGSIQVTELIPQSPLAANSTYVLAGATGKLLSKFITSEATDSQPPAGQIANSLQAFGRTLKIPTATISDAGPGTHEVIFGVWAPRQGENIVLQEAPRTYVLAKQGTLTLGEGGWCDSWNYSFPIEVKQGKLSIVPIDLAGNRGLATEFTVDVRKMRSTPF